MYNVQDFKALYNNAVRLVIFEGCYFIHMSKALAWPHRFTKRRSLGPWKSPLLIVVLVASQESERACVRGINFAFFYAFVLDFWNCSDKCGILKFLILFRNFCRSLLVLFHLAIALSVVRLTASVYPFGNLKLFVGYCCIKNTISNQKWTIQRNWQYRVHKTKTNTNTTQTPQTQIT